MNMSGSSETNEPLCSLCGEPISHRVCSAEPVVERPLANWNGQPVKRWTPPGKTEETRFGGPVEWPGYPRGDRDPVMSEPLFPWWIVVFFFVVVVVMAVAVWRG